MRNKGVIAILCFIVLLLILSMTCPNKNDHKNALIAKVTIIMKHNQNKAGEAEEGNVMSLVSVPVVSGIMQRVVDKILTTNNYILFSLGTVQYNGEKRVVTIGVLSHVFCLFTEKDVEGICGDIIGYIAGGAFVR